MRYAREHHMGKYTLVASNQLGTVESNCDLIVRKKQFPPVFWQRLYNVSGVDDNVRFRVATKILRRFWGRVADTGSMILLLLSG